MDHIKDGAVPASKIFPCHYIRDDGSCSCGRNCDSPAKHPLPANGLKAASNDMEQIERWWKVNPRANIGVLTGKENNLVVVDIDAPDGFDSLLEIEQEFGHLPATVEAITGSGGRHLYYRYPHGATITSRNGWRKGIDIKADSAYVLAPPSINKNGPYVWDEDRSPWDRTPAEMPDWLVDILPGQPGDKRRAQTNGKPSAEANGKENGKADGNRYTFHDTSSAKHRAACYVSKAAPASEGFRNQAAFNLSGHVAAFGLNPEETFELLREWNARNLPPLDERELWGCVQSAFVNGTPRKPKESRDHRTDESAPDSGPRVIEYQRISSAELATGDFRIEYLIDGTMVAGQPLILAGPQKALKTSILIDAAVSLAIGGCFLGRLRVTRPCRVAVMTGESGLGTVQETARRVCEAAGTDLAECERLIWSPDIPRFGSAPHLEALERFLEKDGIEVLFLDPAYLAMPAADAGNLMAQGELLRGIGELCQALGVTMALAHHTKKNTGQDPYEPLELQHIAWAGFAEFARQWWLVNRRERYEPGSGEHRLWLSIGGSAGHNSLWAFDLDEGVNTDPGGRRWEASLSDAATAREVSLKRRDEAKAAARAKQLEADKQTICNAIASLHGKAGTKRDIRDLASLSGTRFNEAFREVLKAGYVVPAKVEKANGQTYEGYSLA